MITLSSELDEVYFSDPAFMQTLCLNAAFKGSALEEDIWVQHTDNGISAALSRHSGRLNLFFCNGDVEELRDFISFLSPAEIFCEQGVAKTLGLEIKKEFTVLLLKKPTAEASSCPLPLSALYSALKYGEDGDVSLPDFEVFAPEISHRLRHNAARAVVSEYGGALAFCCDKGAIISGIAVKPDMRGKGEGKRLLLALLKELKGDIFVCCDPALCEFYKSCGFEITGYTALAKGCF